MYKAGIEKLLDQILVCIMGMKHKGNGDYIRMLDKELKVTSDVCILLKV